MSMLSRLLSLGVKSQLKNVRFLHKLGSRASQNLIIDSPRITIASRQFIVGRVSFLKQQGNPGQELKGIIDCGAGQPAAALFSPSQSLHPLRKGQSSTFSDADTLHRQIKKFRNSREVLQFLDTCDSKQLSRSSLTCVSGQLFAWLKIEKSNAAERTRILACVGMQKLCREVKRHSCSLSPGDLTTICGLFVYLNAPGDHPTFDVVLRLLSKHLSSLTLINIRFLHFLMNRMSEGSKSRISAQITLALPILFECQLSMRLDDTNLGELVNCLEYTVRYNYSVSALKQIVKSIQKKQTQLTQKQARKIVWSLQTLIKRRPLILESTELLQASFKILTANIHLLDANQLNKLLRFYRMQKSTNTTLNHLNSEDSTDAACNPLKEAHQVGEMDMKHEIQIALDSLQYITKNWDTIHNQNLRIPSCRHCAAKKETLGHVLGGCEKGNQLRITRHHEIRSIIANAFREAPSFGQRLWKVEEEVECHDENGLPRTVDIFCYDQEQKVGYIIDPTVRFEQYFIDQQAIKVDHEKRSRYEPCAKYFKDLYGLDQVEAFGLLVGSRGTMTTFFETIRKRFSLSPTITQEIAVVAIRGSTLIVYHHLYTRTRISNCRMEICRKLTLPSLSEVLKS